MMRPVVDALFPLLASGALKGAVLLLAAMAAARMLRGQAAAVRHAVWTMALAGVLLVPVLSLAPGLPTLDAPVAAFAAFDADRPFVLRAPWERDAAPRSDADGSVDRTPAPAQERMRLADVIVVLWLVGAALALAREAVGQGRASGLAARAIADDSPSIRGALRDAVREIGGGRGVPVRWTDEVGGPVTLGVLRPMILLPTAAAEWPAQRLRPALLHELAHVTRRDCATDLLARLACALWWFHPLVWTALRRMRAERERACDDRVLAARVQPVGYAALLVDVARVARGRPLPAAAHALPMAQRMSELESRLRAILDPTLRRRTPSRAAWCLLAAGSMLAVGACAAVRLEAVPQAAVPSPAAGETVATAPEPDRAGDALSHPASERIPGHAARMRNVLAALQPALRGPDSAWAARLREALADEPAGEADLVRERAAWALTRAEGGRLMDPMLRALADADWRVRSYAAWALAQSGDARAVRPLLPLLNDGVWRVRAMAAFALAQTGDPAAEPAMRAALADPAWQVRTSAVEYIGALRDPVHLPLLRARLADRHPLVRDAAQTALARMPS
jgi:beta-lactamase regulating signal transducer with metallopeptidase domain